MQSEQNKSLVKEKRPKGYESLSPEYKAMWDAIVLEHPWFNHSQSKS